MFGIGSTELLVILLVGLIVLGPKSLASLSRTIGKVVGEFRRVSTDFQRTLNAEAAAEEQKESLAKKSPEEREKAEKEAAEEAAEDARREAKRKELKEKAIKKAEEAKQAQAAGTAEEKAPTDKEMEKTSQPCPPEDSPLARALAKTRAEAEAADARCSATSQNASSEKLTSEKVH